MDRRRRLAAAGSGLALAAGILAGPVLAADASVSIAGFAFTPATVTVGVGDSVTWTNNDSTAHTATSGSAWNTGDLGPGESGTVTFQTAGTFDYICGIHPSMSGRVVVTTGGGTAPPTDTGLPRPDAGEPPLAVLGFLAVVMAVAILVMDRRLQARRDER